MKTGNSSRGRSQEERLQQPGKISQKNNASQIKMEMNHDGQNESG